MKTFKGDFFKLLNKLKAGEPFSFVRFSDGEMYVMQKKRLVLAQDHVQTGDQLLNFGYNKEDHKDFDPVRDEKMAHHLIESCMFNAENYYKGISCRCCVGEENFIEMERLALGYYPPYVPLNIKRYDPFSTEEDTSIPVRENRERLTWANLFVNDNYSLFINHFLPEFKKHKLVIVCNENADLFGLPFADNIVKDFRIGPNALVQNYDLVEQVRQWHENAGIDSHVYLLAASSLSNLIAFENFKTDLATNRKNWYIDVGSTLNKHLSLGLARDYLRGYWLSQPNPDSYKECIW